LANAYIYTKVVKNEKSITKISRISKRSCTGLSPRCRYVQRHNKYESAAYNTFSTGWASYSTWAPWALSFML